MSVVGGGPDVGLDRCVSRRWSSAVARGLKAIGARARRLRRGDAADWARRQWAVETEARSGFFLAPAAMMLGIALVYGIGLRPSPFLIVPAAALLLAMSVRLREARLLGPLCLAAGFAGLGVGLSLLELSLTRTTTFSGEATVRIDGIVEGRDRDERGRIRYLVEIERTERPVLSRPPERAQILVSSRHVPIPIGGRYQGLVRLRAPSGPAFPGGYDFASGSHFNGLGAYGFGLGPPDPLPQEVTTPSIAQRFLALRLTISERIRETIGGPEGAVASALITGDRAGIPEEINLWLRTTGLSHVLSISGLHMALVAGFAMAVVRAVLAAIPWCALVLPIKKIAAGAALGVATFYLLLSGSNVATDRSYIMLSIMLVAVFFDRPALTLRNVALAAMVVLALTPHAMMTASFQMSFGATAALLGVYGAYARRAEGRQDVSRGPVLKAVLFLAGLGATSLIAGTATGPYSAYHFQRVQPFGLFANVVALPLFSLWIMPLALIAMVLMPLGLDGPFLVLMGYGLSAVFEIAHVLHDHLPDAPTGLMTPESLVILSVALLIACFLASALRWIALPIAVVGLILAPDRSERPELLVFEDGRELALLTSSGALLPLRTRRNAFVFSQWQRAFPSPATDAAMPSGFVCEEIAEAAETTIANPDAEPPAPPRADFADAAVATTVPATDSNPSQTSVPRSARPKPKKQVCRATTRGGLKVIWTDDYRKLGLACDEADIAIVARAARRETCRSGALLMTLRTLRRTGSVALSRAAASGKAVAVAAIGAEPEEWNRHRLAPWPESWRRQTSVRNEGASPDGERPLGDATRHADRDGGTTGQPTAPTPRKE